MTIDQCIYCGNTTRIAASDYGGPFWVQCDRCGMNGPCAKWQGTEEKSKDLAWERYTSMCQKAHKVVELFEEMRSNEKGQ